jgi:hypothetical protein
MTARCARISARLPFKILRPLGPDAFPCLHAGRRFLF